MQVAYLASGLFLDYKSDLIILVVNTLTQDLKSDNYLVGEFFTLLAQPAAASYRTVHILGSASAMYPECPPLPHDASSGGVCTVVLQNAT